MICGSGAADDVQTRAAANELMLARAVVDQIPDFLFVKDLQSRFVFANAALAAAYGFADPGVLIGKTDFDLHDGAAAQSFFEIEQRIMTRGESMVDLEESFANARGEWRSYSTSKLPRRDPTGAIVGMVGVGRDITERKQLETHRNAQAELLEMIAKNEPLPAVLHRLVLFMEAQLPGLLGSVLLADPATGQLHVGAAPTLPPDFREAIDGLQVGPDAGSCGTAAYRRASVYVADIGADPLWRRNRRALAARHGLTSCWSTPILAHDGGVLGTLALYSDGVRLPGATEMLLIDICTRIAGIAIQRRQAEDRITFIAHHDALTGLPNRSRFHHRLAQDIATAGERGTWVVFIDLDNFKLVNDGLGHKAGDHVLCTIAARLRAGAGLDQAVFRLGGDEFVVLLREGGAVHTLERLNDAVRQPIDVSGDIVRVTCSMGVAVAPRDGRDPDTLLAAADAAMYSAKADGRNAVRLYATSMTAERRAQLELREQLREAIGRNEMYLLYQPQADLATGRIFGAEALLRWRHPTLGLVPPSRFIPIAEESGLIVALGDWVLSTACRQNQAWQAAGAAPISMAVNVSARQFVQRDLAARVREVLQASGMPAEQLDLELTESMLMGDLDDAVGTMVRLKQLGAQLSIDDFGTGYSSLSALKSFPVSRLKIDRSFVQDLTCDENDKAIATAVISMGHALGLRVIAEGVETAEQLDLLARQGCDEVQGYYVSRPISADEMLRLLLAEKAGPCRWMAGRRAPAAEEMSAA